MSIANTAIGFEVTHEFTMAGLYNVSAVVYKVCGTDTLQAEIEIITCEEQTSNPYISNVLTANNDGINDFLLIQNCVANIELHILNRWGNLVYSSKNYNNDWDGKDQKGQPLTEGVYTYRYKLPNGTEGQDFLHLIM